MSRYLFDSYNRLDSTASSTLLNRTKSRPAQWPLLETILSQYCRTINSRGGLLTDDIITERARQIWLKISEYENKSMPEFSQGWISRFKQRYHLARQRYYGEVSSVPDKAYIKMNTLRVTCNGYKPEDIYNIDETCLFWRYAPNSGISLLNNFTGGVKKDKARISLALISNATGSDRITI
jgi:Tc5 transposase DNA-binding domain